MCISSEILFVLRLLFSLGFYDDSGVCSKYFQSRISAVPWAYPLSAHGLGSIRPNLTKVRHAIFLLLQFASVFYLFWLNYKFHSLSLLEIQFSTLTSVSLDLVL